MTYIKQRGLRDPAILPSVFVPASVAPELGPLTALAIHEWGQRMVQVQWQIRSPIHTPLLEQYMLAISVWQPGAATVPNVCCRVLVSHLPLLDTYPSDDAITMAMVGPKWHLAAWIKDAPLNGRVVVSLRDPFGKIAVQDGRLP